MNGERGIGVVEMLVALVLGGILVLIALPQLQRYMALRDLQQTARLLGADLRLTQQYAVTQNQSFRLAYAVASSQYSLLRISDGTVVKLVAVPSTVTVTSTFPSNNADFAGTGAPAQTGTFCLTEGTAILRVDVQPATGRVQATGVLTCP